MNVLYTRLDHVEHDKINNLAKQGLLGSIQKLNCHYVKSLMEDRLTGKPFCTAIRFKKSLQLKHSNICAMSVRQEMGYPIVLHSR